jgi:hypothetical protein
MNLQRLMRSSVLLAHVLLYGIFSSSNGAFVKLDIVRVDGLPLPVYLGTDATDVTPVKYRMVSKECRNGICATMGILDPSFKFLSLYSAEGLDESSTIAIAIRIRRQVPLHSSFANIDSRTSFLSSAVLGGNASLSDRISTRQAPGSHKPINESHENHFWNVEDTLIAEYVVECSVRELRECGNGCFFSSKDTERVLSEPKHAVRENQNLPPLHLVFKLLLLGDDSPDLPTPSSRLLAAKLAEHAERGENEMQKPVTFEWLASSTRSGMHTVIKNLTSINCLSYKHIASIGDGVAHVWYLQTEHKQNWIPQELSPPEIVIAFRFPKQTSIGSFESRYRLDDLELQGEGALQANVSPPLGRVGVQYLMAYKGIAKEIRSYLIPGAALMLSGFSESAGIATVAFADFVMDDVLALRKVYSTVFSSPQVGDIDFLNRFHQHVRTKPRYGYFERVVVAQATSRTIDADTLLPSSIGEHFGTLQKFRAMACLRRSVEMRNSPGLDPNYLASYAHIGLLTLIFNSNAGIHDSNIGPRRSSFSMFTKHENVAAAFSSKNDISDWARSALFLPPSLDKVDMYMERLLHEQRLRWKSESADAVHRFRIANVMRQLVHSTWPNMYPSQSTATSTTSRYSPDSGFRKCRQTDSLSHHDNLVVHLTITGGQPLGVDEEVSVSLCLAKTQSSMSSSCHMLPAINNEEISATTNIDSPSTKTFRTFRADIADNLSVSHLRFSIHRLAHPPNCEPPMTNIFPPEHFVMRQARKKLIVPTLQSGARYGIVHVRDTEISYKVERGANEKDHLSYPDTEIEPSEAPKSNQRDDLPNHDTEIEPSESHDGPENARGIFKSNTELSASNVNISRSESTVERFDEKRAHNAPTEKSGNQFQIHNNPSIDPSPKSISDDKDASKSRDPVFWLDTTTEKQRKLPNGFATDPLSRFEQSPSVKSQSQIREQFESRIGTQGVGDASEQNGINSTAQQYVKRHEHGPQQLRDNHVAGIGSTVSKNSRATEAVGQALPIQPSTYPGISDDEHTHGPERIRRSNAKAEATWNAAGDTDRLSQLNERKAAATDAVRPYTSSVANPNLASLSTITDERSQRPSSFRPPYSQESDQVSGLMSSTTAERVLASGSTTESSTSQSGERAFNSVERPVHAVKQIETDGPLGSSVGRIKNSTHCLCQSGHARDCLVPIPEQSGRCRVEECMRVRCSSQGTGVCNMTQLPQFVVQQDYAMEGTLRCEFRVAAVPVPAWTE